MMDLIASRQSVVEGEYNAVDANNAVASVEKGSLHCAKMKAKLNQQFKPQVGAVVLFGIPYTPCL